MGLGLLLYGVSPMAQCFYLVRIPSTSESAALLGLVTLQNMLASLVWAVDHTPESVRVIEALEIRSIRSRKR